MTERQKPTTPPSRAKKLEQALKIARAQKEREDQASRAFRKPSDSPSAAKGVRAAGLPTAQRSGAAKVSGAWRDLPDARPPATPFRDRDGKTHTFPESALKRLAAELLAKHKKGWRYRPFGFPLVSDSGAEHEFFFDFYIYDNMDTILRLIVVSPRDSRELWDRLGRFKRQYGMYEYEVWTPQAIGELWERRRLKF